MNKRNFELLGSFSVLYIEDEADLRKHTTSILEDFVKIIYPVSSIDEALEVIKNERVDVIIADIHLRHSNGLDFLRKLKQELELEIPSIVTTAFSDTEYLLDAIKLRVDNYLIKPVNIKELLNSLHDVLLPKIQAKEIERSYNIIKTISAVTDSKQVEIIRFIIKNLDHENMLNYSYSEIMEQVDVSKPTVIKLFKQLGDQGILTKIQNKKYHFNETNLPLPGDI
ncbi:response regulator transcription factor [Sulfurospirillum barnesii]|uniref:Response regulator with CheY-like receiver, AAA-type ATPase, and DNA-binding domains n=1 Tax=Sulfurospirillum barnesii (strain ATCC 700032 / DSM 10660 / SES-3) TaxID=760154 RepID=I3XZX3_SULBS|nr:response regulator transcription factor [Sulfurospirillum barnesii]AFL69497.1 response regulator with CheY-like receiver, AAA-type ATPase, and DNA-binding domains [Sulfurospirillum barnesii SES-3]